MRSRLSVHYTRRGGTGTSERGRPPEERAVCDERIASTRVYTSFLCELSTMAAVASNAASALAGRCGIDFGTSSCKVANCRGADFSNLDARIIVDPMGDFSIASYVAVDDEGGYVVGNVAKQQMEKRAKYTCAHVKKLFGVADAEVSLVNKMGKKVVVPPTKIGSILMKQVMSVATDGVGVEMKHAVLAVPNKCSPEKLAALSDTAKQANLNVLQFISETSAVALAYGLDEEEGTGDYVVLDIGFESTRVAVLSASNGYLSVKSQKEIEGVGGRAMSDRFVALVVREFQAQHGKDLTADAHAMLKLSAACEHAKHTLSVSTRAIVEVDALLGVDFRYTVNQAKYETECSDVFLGIMSCVADAMKDAGVLAKDIQNVLLAGASSQTPRIQAMLAGVFEHIASDIQGSRSFSPADAVALGSAKQASMLCLLAESPEDIATVVSANQQPVVPSLPLSVSVLQRNGLVCPVFARGTALPVSRKISLTNGPQLTFFSGERPSAAGNFTLGSIPVDEAKEPKTYTIALDEAQNLLVDGVSVVMEGAAISADDIAKHISDAVSAIATQEDERARAIAKLNEFVFKIQESDYLQDLEEEDMDIVNKEVEAISSRKESAADVDAVTALLTNLTTKVEDILAEYEEEEEEIEVDAEDMDFD